MESFNGDNGPLIERLDDARARLERMIDSGMVNPDEAMRQALAIREDLVFIERHASSIHNDIHYKIKLLEEKKVDKNPNANRAFWIVLTTVISVVGGYVLWALTTGLQTQ